MKTRNSLDSLSLSLSEQTLQCSWELFLFACKKEGMLMQCKAALGQDLVVYISCTSSNIAENFKTNHPSTLKSTDSQIFSSFFA